MEEINIQNYTLEGVMKFIADNFHESTYLNYILYVDMNENELNGLESEKS